jgi:hypothetical protein
MVVSAALAALVERGGVGRRAYSSGYLQHGGGESFLPMCSTMKSLNTIQRKVAATRSIFFLKGQVGCTACLTDFQTHHRLSTISARSQTKPARPLVESSNGMLSVRECVVCFLIDCGNARKECWRMFGDEYERMGEEMKEERGR